MLADYNTDGISSPGWNRTTDLLRVGEAPWPLDHGTVSNAEFGTRNAELTSIPHSEFQIPRSKYPGQESNPERLVRSEA